MTLILPVIFIYLILAIALVFCSKYVRFLFKILIFIGLIMLSIIAYGVLRALELQCIDAGEICIRQIRTFSDPTLIISIALPFGFLSFILLQQVLKNRRS